MDLRRHPPAMASSTTTPSDFLPYTAAGTPTMDNLLRNVYPPMAQAQHRAEEEAWGQMAAERKDGVGMTLEDFLAREGVGEEEFRVSPVRYSEVGLQEGRFVGVPPLQVQQAVVQGDVDAGAGLWRGKRRAALLEPLVVDRVTQQRQRRVIKNRESAARSRERKQVFFFYRMNHDAFFFQCFGTNS